MKYRVVESQFNDGSTLYFVERRQLGLCDPTAMHVPRWIRYTSIHDTFHTLDAALKFIDQCKSNDLVSEKVVYDEEKS